MEAALKRRDVFRLGLAGRAGAAMTACGSSPSAEKSGRTLLAYFSRPGENHWYGGRRDLRVGNAEVLAGLIADRLGCDVHRIRPAAPYSDDYDETVARNVREQDADARPAIADPLRSIDRYDAWLRRARLRGAG